jgi:hypothetical protein
MEDTIYNVLVSFINYKRGAGLVRLYCFLSNCKPCSKSPAAKYLAATCASTLIRPFRASTSIERSCGFWSSTKSTSSYKFH